MLHTPIHQVALVWAHTKEASLNAVWCVMHKEQLSYKGYRHGTIIFGSTSVDSYYTKVWMKLDSLRLVWWIDWRNIHKKWNKESTKPTWIGSEESSCCSMFFISTKAQCQHLDQNCRWLPNWIVHERQLLMELSILRSLRKHFLFYLRVCNLVLMRASGFRTNMPISMFYSKCVIGSSPDTWISHGCPIIQSPDPKPFDFCLMGTCHGKCLWYRCTRPHSAWSVKPS
jgi:hypothetical protein